MSPEVAGLIGAGIGAAATLIIGIATRLWANQDARTHSRQRYVEHVAERLQRVIAEPTVDGQRRLNDEMFQVATFSVYVPSGEGVVALWYSLQDVRIMQLAIDSRLANRAQQAEVFSESVDVINALRGWARREWGRRRPWFWWQLRTTDREYWLIGKNAAKREKAAKRKRAPRVVPDGLRVRAPRDGSEG